MWPNSLEVFAVEWSFSNICFTTGVNITSHSWAFLQEVTNNKSNSSCCWRTLSINRNCSTFYWKKLLWCNWGTKMKPLTHGWSPHSLLQLQQYHHLSFPYSMWKEYTSCRDRSTASILGTYMGNVSLQNHFCLFSIGTLLSASKAGSNTIVIQPGYFHDFSPTISPKLWF